MQRTPRKSLRFSVAAASIALLLSGVSGHTTTNAPSLSKDGFEHVTTKDQYLARVVGHAVKLAGGESVTTTSADGKLTGDLAGIEIDGTWVWHDRYLCQEASIGGIATDSDCQALEVSDTKLRVTRNRGAGSTTVFELIQARNSPRLLP